MGVWRFHALEFSLTKRGRENRNDQCQEKA
jgi:hypothetical protein